jgi:hypothetical protein
VRNEDGDQKFIPGDVTVVKIEDWVSSKENQHPVCLLFGSVGLGKTAIAQHVALLFDQVGDRKLAGTFFRRGDEKRNNAKQLFPTLAHQSVRSQELSDDCFGTSYNGRT